jgi:hypothetical protein
LKERDYSLCIDDDIFGRPTKDLLHKSSIEEPHLNLPQNCHTKHYTRHIAKPILVAGIFFNFAFKVFFGFGFPF